MRGRIDSQTELIEFIHLLKSNNIEIPENVTLEIDSKYLKEEIILEAHKVWNFHISNDVNRFNYMGEKIKFKQEEQW